MFENSTVFKYLPDTDLQLNYILHMKKKFQYFFTYNLNLLFNEWKKKEEKKQPKWNSIIF